MPLSHKVDSPILKSPTLKPVWISRINITRWSLPILRYRKNDIEVAIDKYAGIADLDPKTCSIAKAKASRIYL